MTKKDLIAHVAKKANLTTQEMIGLGIAAMMLFVVFKPLIGWAIGLTQIEDPTVKSVVFSQWTSMLSLVEVNMIGEAAVPTAFIFPPLATINAEAKDPVPALPLIIVPASMVKVTPSCTTTLLSNS